jgi:beta-ketodecanoyl-[acyl-carrier-protein] synthase
VSTRVAITGSGVHVPAGVVTNAELVLAFNAWADRENERNVANGWPEVPRSSSEFIERASGILERRLVDREGVLDPERMRPEIPDRADDQPSLQAELALLAAKSALEEAGRSGEEIDLVVVGASALQRPYPAIAIEVQQVLGASGFAYDVSVGCSSGGFALQLAMQAITSGSARRALVCVPEIPSAYANFRERSSHFILGDAAVACVLEPLSSVRKEAFEIVSSECITRFSNNVRNNGGFLNRCDPAHRDDDDKLFYQNGRGVYKDITRLVPTFVAAQLAKMQLGPCDVARYWLHQANRAMLDTIAERLLKDEWDHARVPLPLVRYGNTAAAGALISFAENRDELEVGSYGVICAFGAGYSLSSQVVRKI